MGTNKILFATHATVNSSYRLQVFMDSFIDSWSALVVLTVTQELIVAPVLS